MIEEPKVKRVRPQVGFQEKFLSSTADITIGGGAAGSGKTWTEIVESLYDIDNPKFRAIYFRRKKTELMPLIIESRNIFSKITPAPEYVDSKLTWSFPSGATVEFSHLQYEKDKYNHQGQEYAFIGFDELTHFTQSQFTYLISRNRSTSGAISRVKATCNPEADHWVANLIDWWIGDDGFPIEKRSGKVRYFVSAGERIDEFIWGDSRKECAEKASYILDDLVRKANEKINTGARKITKDDFVKSITFIGGSIYENQALLDKDPTYLASLVAQGEVGRKMLLEGNWKFKMKGDELVGSDAMDSIFENYPNTNGRRAITCDVAGKGSDLMVVFVWDGFHLIDFYTVSRTDGKQIVDILLGVMSRYRIKPRDVVFDANGVGSHIDGYIKGATEFKRQSQPVAKEYYGDLETQCAERWADRINGKIANDDTGLTYSIDSNLINKLVNGKTLQEHLQHERKAIRMDESSMDRKPTLIKKSEMKATIGNSPDFVEAMIMLEYLYLKKITSRIEFNW